MFSKFDEDARKVLINSKKEMKELKHPYIGTEHLFLALLNLGYLEITKKLNKNGINYNNFKQMLIKLVGIGNIDNKWFLYTPLLKRIIEDSIIICRENNDEEVTINHLISALFEEGEGVAIRILMCLDIDIDNISKEFIIKKGNKLHSKKKLQIEEFGYNMNEKVVNNEIDPVIGRDEEIERMVEILCRRIKNNPLLIGDAGVGKTAIVEELSRRIVNGMVPDKLKNKKIISISMASLVAGTKYRGEFEERIEKLLTEIESNPEIIIFIDEIHTLVGAGAAEGAIDASNILKPYLSRGKLKLIGATTISEYKKNLEDDHALDRRFQTIIINEPNPEKTFEILKKLKPLYESFHNVIISDEVLKSIIELSNKYIYNRKQPDKSIDILDEACSRVSVTKSKKIKELDNLKLELKQTRNEKNSAVLSQNFIDAALLKEKENELEDKINKLEYSLNIFKSKKTVSKKIVADIIKIKTNMPVYEVNSESISNFRKLENTLNSKIVGQKEIIKSIVQDIKRIRLGYKEDNKPRSYLFVGRTGVGKTLLAKELNKFLTNNNDMIRLDMSEYKEPHTISKIIGSPPGYIGYSNKTTILDQIKLNHNSIILLDEIEKSCSEVMNLFLQALDEGYIKNSNNEEIRLDNNIIIMTSNIGFKNSSIGFNKSNKDKINRNIKDLLGVEFVNRIDRVFIFNDLSYADIKKIVLNSINGMMKLFDLKPLNFKLKNDVIDQIIELSEYREYGARKVDKIIKDKLYDKIIDEKMNKSVNITIETI